MTLAFQVGNFPWVANYKQTPVKAVMIKKKYLGFGKNTSTN